MARIWSRRLAAAQTIAVIEEGGRTVSLGSILGPEFAAAPAVLFGPDQFHPSAQGYLSLVGVLLPSVLAALDLAPDDEASPEAYRGEGVLPVARAAVQAVKQPGTELDGLRGRLVELRHRRRRPQADAAGAGGVRGGAGPRSRPRPTPLGGPAPSSAARRAS